ncbi:MAG TPA: leucine--tRNA ligase [Planctomycetaceae bacterium]|nr:leucine--tRNA ligase [Planctomycetaceae bacterium]
MDYGTGAIMAVPGHDQRDFEFATKYGLPIPRVVAPSADQANKPFDGEAEVGEGVLVNSDFLDGMEVEDAKRAIIARIEEQGRGSGKTVWRLRDWGVSRQRYWGTPIPFIHCEKCGVVPAPKDSLPITLPEDVDFRTPGNPLLRHPTWKHVDCPTCGGKAERETDTLDTFVDSSWYFLRFASQPADKPFDRDEIAKWLPVEQYIGGIEHAILHLLYARFWHKVLFDLGHLHSAEPFHKLVNQGMILGEAEFTAYRVAAESAVSDQRDEPFADDLQQNWVSSRNVEEKDSKYLEKETGAILEAVLIDEKETAKKGNDFILKSDTSIVIDSRAHKMSKSRGNVINPDDIVNDYGADSLRLYEMFMGPLEQTKPWNMSGVEGVYRFLGRVWRMIVDERNDDATVLHADVQDVELNDEQTRTLHKTIKAVTEDIEKLSFNTAISRMMEFTNEFSSQQPRPKSAMIPFVQLLNPFAPHIAEELWEVLGQTESLTYSEWPKFDESKLVESEIEIPVQINGKLRAKIKVPAEADKDAMESAAKVDETIIQQLEGKQIVKTICVPGRMVNFVVKG